MRIVNQLLGTLGFLWAEQDQEIVITDAGFAMIEALADEGASAAAHGRGPRNASSRAASSSSRRSSHSHTVSTPQPASRKAARCPS